MKFEKVTLPYAYDALEPIISRRTIEFHYGKHHQAYVDNLNKMIIGTDFENETSLEKIVKESSGGIFNNAGQVLNHNLYFSSFKAEGEGKPLGELSKAIDAQYGSFEQFKEQFNKAAVSIFGSGWAWLSRDNDGKLYIEQYANGDNPVRKNLTPILCFDVWEHSYYLDYQNQRATHIDEIWKIINWETVSNRY